MWALVRILLDKLKLLRIASALAPLNPDNKKHTHQSCSCLRQYGERFSNDHAAAANASTRGTRRGQGRQCAGAHLQRGGTRNDLSELRGDAGLPGPAQQRAQCQHLRTSYCYTGMWMTAFASMSEACMAGTLKHMAEAQRCQDGALAVELAGRNSFCEHIEVSGM